ncbi:MAG: proton-conducting transporter membrane subunit [Candidatus Omnitrophica bacterium]|nr:proton-conducting transporter membrane subunit [Candidatus Omnitrophota bacterium]
MTALFLLLLIGLPFAAGASSFLLPKKMRGIYAFAVTAVNFIIAVSLFKKEFVFHLPWAGFGMDLSMRLYPFSGFIILAVAFFALLVTLHSLNFLKDKESAGQFYAYILLSLSFVNGAVLADNLMVLLFFWEALILTTYGFIAIGGRQAFKTATKAAVILGVSGLCMMAGAALTEHLAKTLVISGISLPLDKLGGLAFMLLAIGAISKSGAVPFHTWIPDAAEDSPLPFMAFFPASIGKLLGIYFLARITLDMFKLNAGSVLSIVIMVIGAATILLAVMMALIQKDYKRVLSYHAVSQAGYMILGIGTCLPAGIIGGIFHMLNYALYKCGLFLTAGSVEKQTGTTNLEELGALRSKMPVTFICFLITAASISGVPPLNGFFSNSLVYNAALERGKIFYLAAILGSFFTAVSFLKLGHAAFLGRMRKDHQGVREAHPAMLVPMVIMALACVIIGVFSSRFLNNFIRPVLGKGIEGHGFTGPSANIPLIIITLVSLAGAFISHFLAVRIKGDALKATDYIHCAPVLSVIYRWAQKRYFDPYEVGMKLIGAISKLLWWIDRGIDRIYDSIIPGAAFRCSAAVRSLHSGYYVIYVTWSLLAALVVMLFAFK